MDSIQMTGESQKKEKLNDEEKLNLKLKLNAYDDKVEIGAHIVI